MRDPRSVLKEFGFEPEGEIAVWDASAETRYLVLPRRPADTDDWDEERLASVVTRNGLIGTAPI